MKQSMRRLLSLLLCFPFLLSGFSARSNSTTETTLAGKTALFVGDALCYGEYDTTPGVGYAGRLGERYSLTVTNSALPSASFSTASPHRIVAQLRQHQQTPFHYVMLQGGFTDSVGSAQSNPAPVGRVSDSFDPKDFDLTTFAGGLEEAIYYATLYFPQAVIGYVNHFSCPQMDTDPMAPYFYEALKICSKWKVPVIDLFNDPYVTNTLLDTDSNTYLKTETQLNAKGYDRLAPYLGQQMSNMASREAMQQNPYQGKRVLFVGSSSTYGYGDTTGKGWPGRMGDLLGIVPVNKGANGASISTIRTGRVINQLKSAGNDYFDYVILHGGVNDAWGNEPDWIPAPVGEITEGYARKDFDVDTFAGALEELFYYARRYFPYARLGFILQWEIPSDICADMGIYQEVILELCRKWQVDCLDMYGQDVRGTLLENGSLQYMVDVAHLNTAGYDKITPYIIDWFKTIPYTDTAILENEAIYTEIMSVNETINKIGEVTMQNYTQKLPAIAAAEAEVSAMVEQYGDGILSMMGQYQTLLAAREAYEAMSNPAAGDVDGSGKVDAVDALWTLQSAVGKRTLSEHQTKAADMNGDGKLDATDALKILQTAVGK